MLMLALHPPLKKERKKKYEREKFYYFFTVFSDTMVLSQRLELELEQNIFPVFFLFCVSREHPVRKFFWNRQ
jgi:hypothetical protein